MAITSKIVRASLVLGFFSFMADVAGLLRDRVLAAHFGASRTLDIYYSAFKIPDTIFNLLVAGALSSAFIPVFIEHYRKERDQAWHIAQNFLNVGFFAVAAAVAVMGIFAQPLVHLVAPGFAGHDRTVLIGLTRLMLVSPLLFSVSAVLGSVLQAVEGFLSYAIAPVLYNAGLIVGALYLAPWAGSHGYEPVYGLGVGVILGAALHATMNLAGAMAAGFRFKNVFRFDVHLRRIFVLMVPRAVALGGYSLGTIVINAFASTMAIGSIAIFNFANNLQFVPIAVVGISVATAVFPRLSHHAAGMEHEDFRRKLNDALRMTLAVIVPVSIFLGVFSPLVVRILFGVGAFRGFGVRETASVLSIFMIGVWAQSLTPIVVRAFYAFQDTATTAFISLGTLTLHIAMSSVFTFVFHWGVRGLAVSLVISEVCNFLLVYAFFRRRYLSAAGLFHSL